MIPDETDTIMAAYWRAVGESWDDIAGIHAAEAIYAQLHPESTDKRETALRVSRIVALALLTDPDPRSSLYTKGERSSGAL